MGRRKKLAHFQDLHDWAHVYQPKFDDDLNLKGSWGNKVILELACGQGAYTIALAQIYPDATIIGVDIKGARMWHGARLALTHAKNARFLRTRIEELERFFNKNEVDEIWITFPDPHPREGKAAKRLSSARFLKIYEEILKPDGVVHLKTDSTDLYEWTKQSLPDSGWKILQDIPNVYGAGVYDEILHIKTPYERRYLKEGRTIHYLLFQPATVFSKFKKSCMVAIAEPCSNHI